MAKSVEITGDKELDALFRAFPSKVRRRLLRGALAKAAAVVLAEAKLLVPVRTGLLKRSLKVGAGRPRRYLVTRGVQTQGGLFRGKTFYGGMQEFGTKRMRAHPFLRPALDSQRVRVVELFRQEMSDSINAFRQGGEG